MPIDNRGEGRDHSPSGWDRIQTEQAQRDASARKWDAQHDPSEEFERAARPLPDDYGKDRPTSRMASQDQLSEMVELWGQRAVDRLIASGRITVEGNQRPDAGQEPPLRGQANDTDHEQGRDQERSNDHGPGTPGNSHGSDDGRRGDTTLPAAGSPADQEPNTQEHARPDRSDIERSGGKSDAWDNVEGEKPDRAGIHVNDAQRVHILDGNGDGDGGHFAGTGLPLKSEFPERWDDQKVIREVEDVAQNPDYPPRLADRGRWEAVGTRDGVEIRVIVERDGTIVTGFPERGAGVIRNDRYGNPQAHPG